MLIKNAEEYLNNQKFNLLISYVHSRRYKWTIKKIIKNLNIFKEKKLKILDIGSGHSLIIDYLQKAKLNFEYIGIEPNDSYFNYAKKRYSNMSNVTLIKKPVEEVIDDFADIDIYIALESLASITEDTLIELINIISKKNYKLFLCTVNNEIGPALLIKNLGSYLFRYKRHKAYTLKETFNATFYKMHKNRPHKSKNLFFNWKFLLHLLHQKMIINSISSNPSNLIPSELSPNIFIEAKKRI